MAKDLSAATGIGTDGNYLNGNLVDEQTRCDSHINQDIVQFFQKLMDSAGFTANGNFDNETNGYQFVDALTQFIAERDGGLLSKKVNIGTWDMQSTASVNVPIPAGISPEKIITWKVTIVRVDGLKYPLDYKSEGWSFLDDNTNSFDLNRLAGGIFDNLGFSGAENRGHITFRYEL